MERRRSLPAIQDYSAKLVLIFDALMCTNNIMHFEMHLNVLHRVKLQDVFKIIRSKHKSKLPKASNDFLTVLQEESGQFATIMLETTLC